MASKIKQLQSEIEQRIEHFFVGTNVAIMSRLRGHITNDISANLAKNKIVVMCFPPSIGGVKANVSSAVLAEDCKMQIRVLETPSLNRTGVDAYEAVERIMSICGFRTSDGTTISISDTDDVSPDNTKAIDFVVNLKFKATFQKIN